MTDKGLEQSDSEFYANPFPGCWEASSKKNVCLLVEEETGILTDGAESMCSHNYGQSRDSLPTVLFLTRKENSKLTGLCGTAEERSIDLRVCKEKGHCSYCAPAGSPGHLEQTQAARRLGAVAGVSLRERESGVLCDVSRGWDGVGWGQHILLTIKQTSRPAEHCRENDITAEF